MLNNGFNKEQLNFVANIVQILNYIENSQQISNDKILLELQKQNKVYLEEILNRLKILEEKFNSKENKNV